MSVTTCYLIEIPGASLAQRLARDTYDHWQQHRHTVVEGCSWDAELDGTELAVGITLDGVATIVYGAYPYCIFSFENTLAIARALRWEAAVSKALGDTAIWRFQELLFYAAESTLGELLFREHAEVEQFKRYLEQQDPSLWTRLQ